MNLFTGNPPGGTNQQGKQIDIIFFKINNLILETNIY